MKAIERLLDEARELPIDQRLTLANRLLEESEPPATEGIAREWDHTIRDRIARYDQGLNRTRPVGEVLADLDRKLDA